MLQTPTPYRYPQLAKEPLLTGKAGANASNRIWAKMIDLAIVLIFSFSVKYFSLMLAIITPPILFSVMDQWGRGQSPGKWLLGLHTIETPKGTLASTLACFIRNAPFIFLVWGILSSHWLAWLLILPSVIWIAFETYFLISLHTSVRVGDIVSNTRVFDYKDEHTKFIEQFLKDDRS